MTFEAGLTGRTALITGAGRGIGRAVALALADAGANVAVNDLDAEPAEAAAEEVRNRGRGAVTVVGSAADEKAVERFVDEAERAFGAVDVLVCAAGIAGSGRRVHRTDLEEIESLFRAHVLGAAAPMKAVIPGMRARRWGRIVVVSSAAVESIPAAYAPYSMAKAALEALALTAARENERAGIRVNVVRPGLVDTRLGATVVDRLGIDPSSRGPQMLRPEEVAAAVTYLASDASAYVTGQAITVGGSTARAVIDALTTATER